jgi:lactoylglutathione lyase
MTAMKIEHVALWSRDIEPIKDFYEKYFDATAGQKYVNPRKSFSSHFLSFASGARLEIMQMPPIPDPLDSKETQFTGYIHIAISVGSKEGVDQLTERLRADGRKIMDGPRFTGDGYYESVVLDPDGNRVEITV